MREVSIELTQTRIWRTHNFSQLAEMTVLSMLLSVLCVPFVVNATRSFVCVHFVSAFFLLFGCSRFEGKRKAKRRFNETTMHNHDYCGGNINKFTLQMRVLLNFFRVWFFIALFNRKFFHSDFCGTIHHIEYMWVNILI